MQKAEIVCGRCDWGFEARLSSPPEAYSERLEGDSKIVGGLVQGHFDTTGRTIFKIGGHKHFTVTLKDGAAGFIETSGGATPRYAAKDRVIRYKELQKFKRNLKELGY